MAPSKWGLFRGGGGRWIRRVGLVMPGTSFLRYTYAVRTCRTAARQENRPFWTLGGRTCRAPALVCAARASSSAWI